MNNTEKIRLLEARLQIMAANGKDNHSLSKTSSTSKVMTLLSTQTFNSGH